MTKRINWQYEKICPKLNAKQNPIDWYNLTKTGKQSITLNDGLIDAYCITLYAQNIKQTLQVPYFNQ